MTTRRSLFLALALVVVSIFAFSSSANAQSNPDYVEQAPTSTVQDPGTSGIATGRPVGNAVSARSSAAASGRQSLAITGSDLTGFAVIGAVLVAGGAALLVTRRRVAA